MFIDSGISQHYKVEVSFPSDVFCLIMEKHETQYLNEMLQATNGCIRSGSSTYAECVEWATFDIYEDAQRARSEMRDVVAKYANLVGAT